MQHDVAGVRIHKERTMTGLPNVNIASLEDDIRQLVEKEFGSGKSITPETGSPNENTAKLRLRAVHSTRG